jgi:cell division protein FtsW
MNATALSSGLRARERLPFVWDGATLMLVAALLLIGLVMVTSASMSIAARDLGNPFFYLERQFVYGMLGLLVAWIVTRIPTGWWDRYSLALVALGMLLLLLVLIPGLGATVNGARRWMRIGPVNFQVSELAKVLVLTWVCSYCVRKRAELEKTLTGLLKPAGMLGLAGALLLLEPDFGATTVLVASGLAVLFVAGARLRYVLVAVLLAAAALGLLAFTSAYRFKRMMGFLHPWADPFNSGFQLTQSLIAIGRGSWLGVGLGSSVQKLFYLPEAHTDFVFAVLAEEFGLAGVLAVIALFVALVWRAFRIARLAAQAGMQFQSLLALAFGVWIGLQSSVNIGVNMGVLPTKGLTLPLLSYGRSSLLVTLAWIGVLLRIHHEVCCASRSGVLRERGAAPSPRRAAAGAPAAGDAA